MKSKNKGGIIMNQKKLIYALILFAALMLINGVIVHSPQTATEWGSAASLPILASLIYYAYPGKSEVKPEGNYFIRDGVKVFDKKEG
jgi:hypothetical protein